MDEIVKNDNQELCWHSEVSISCFECYVCDGMDLTCEGFISVRDKEKELREGE